MLADYHQQAAERSNLGIPPLPLNATQTSQLCELLKNPPEEQKEESEKSNGILLKKLLTNCNNNKIKRYEIKQNGLW